MDHIVLELQLLSFSLQYKECISIVSVCECTWPISRKNFYFQSKWWPDLISRLWLADSE